MAQTRGWALCQDGGFHAAGCAPSAGGEDARLQQGERAPCGYSGYKRPAHPGWILRPPPRRLDGVQRALPNVLGSRACEGRARGGEGTCFAPQARPQDAPLCRRGT